MNELIESHMYLVSFVINKLFFAKNQDIKEEMMSIGYEALVVAAHKYEPKRSKFSTFAILKIRSWIIDFFIKSNRLKRTAFQTFSIDGKWEDGATWHELVEDETAQYAERVVFQIDIEGLLSRLSQEEREILSLFLGLDEEEGQLRLREIGERMGLTTGVTWKRKKQAMAKLRAEVLAG
jgi:RNA polymerase sigma factor (sigma-70 family)